MEEGLEGILGKFRTDFDILLAQLAEDIRVLMAQPKSVSTTGTSALVFGELEFPVGDVYHSDKHYYFGYRGSPARIEASSAKGKALRHMLIRKGMTVSKQELSKAAKCKSIVLTIYQLIRDVNTFSAVFSLNGSAKNGYTLKAEKDQAVETDDESLFERHGDIYIGRNRIYVGKFAGHAYLDGNSAESRIIRHFINNIGVAISRYDLPPTVNGLVPEAPLQFLKKVINFHSAYYELVNTGQGYMLREKTEKK